MFIAFASSNILSIKYLKHDKLYAMADGSTFVRRGVKIESSICGIRLLFASNQLAFMIDGPYGRGHLRELSGMGRDYDAYYGVTAIPLGPSGKSESVLLSHGLAISRQVQNPDQAYRWIEFLATDEDNARLYFDEFGMIPCNRDHLHRPHFASNHFASVLIRQVESAPVGPIEHPLFLKILPFLLQAIAGVILHDQDPAKSLASIKELTPMISRSESLL